MQVYVYKSNEKWGDGYYIVSSDITKKEMQGKLCCNIDDPVGPFEIPAEQMEFLDHITLRGRMSLNGKVYWDNTWVE